MSYLEKARNYDYGLDINDKE